MTIGRFDGGSGTTIFSTFIIAAFLLQSSGAQTTGTSTDGSSSNPNPYNYGRLTPSMAILLVIFIIVVFFMVFFAIYIRTCSAAARGSVTPAGIGRASCRGQRGLDPVILGTFPTFSYSEVKSHKIGKGALECAVCLNEFVDEETLRFLPKCDHVFHQECIDAWLASHSTCPVCRANLDRALEATVSIENAPEPSAVESTGDEGINEITDIPRSFLATIAQPESVDRSKSSNPEPPLPIRSTSTKTLFFSTFPRSNSTGHCVVQPGENLDRFTLTLPVEIRNQIMNRTLNRSTSVLVLPTENSLRKACRTGNGPRTQNGSIRQNADGRWWSGLFRSGSISNASEGTSRIMGILRQMSVKFGSRNERSGSIRDKSTRPAV